MLCKVDISLRIPVLDLFDSLLQMSAHFWVRTRGYTILGVNRKDRGWNRGSDCGNVSGKRDD